LGGNNISNPVSVGNPFSGSFRKDSSVLDKEQLVYLSFELLDTDFGASQKSTYK